MRVELLQLELEVGNSQGLQALAGEVEGNSLNPPTTVQKETDQSLRQNRR